MAVGWNNGFLRLSLPVLGGKMSAELPWLMTYLFQLNVEDDALVLPEKLKNTSTPPLMGLRFIKERMEALLEEQDQGIEAKMGEVKMYTDMLEKLRKGKGV